MLGVLPSLLLSAVASHTEAWIEIAPYPYDCYMIHWSPPIRRRGLKYINHYQIFQSSLSPPIRRRGLKLPSAILQPPVDQVASNTEAWIEIIFSTQALASSRGRLPYGGVDWNITGMPALSTSDESPPIRRRGLKYLQSLRLFRSHKSPPIRRRGLKYFHRVPNLDTYKCRLPYGGVDWNY